MTGEWRTSTPHLVEVYERVRAFVRWHRLKVSYQWVLRSENKDADAVCTVAHNTKGPVVLFEQLEVNPSYGQVCTVSAVSGNHMWDMYNVDDENTVDAAGESISSDAEDDLEDVTLPVGKRCQGRPRQPRPVEAK